MRNIKYKNVIGIITVCSLTILLSISALASGGQSTSNSYGANKVTIAGIKNFYNTHPFKFDSVTYQEQPSTVVPYRAGSVSQKSLNEALNALNLMRYIAGLPADVTLNSQYNTYAQHASLVLAALGEGLSHYPAKPNGMSNSMYQLGYLGASSSNISGGYPNIIYSLIGCMIDSGSNIDTVGHRRWILNPSMQATGFGIAADSSANNVNYSATYAFDTSRNGVVAYDYIAWPSTYMPVELSREDIPWSVTLGSNYKKPDLSASVTVKRIKDGKVWKFSNNNSSNYFTVNLAGYGVNNCIIFRPSDYLTYRAGDKYQVSIAGIYLANGTPTTLNYQVEFFDLGINVTSITLNKNTLSLTQGKTETLKATVLPSSAINKSLQWYTSNRFVATVDNTGKVTATGDGTAVITVMATDKNTVIAECTVTVSKEIQWKYGMDGELRYYKNGKMVTNEFAFDGNYTYFLQADGTPMKDRMTYHPDGKHIIYFDESGHELFNTFKYCPNVGYTCYFDSNGYLYKDTITFVNNKPYYLDQDGRMKQNGWFRFANGVDFGYAYSNGALKSSGFSNDPYGRVVFYHWNGMVARGLISDGIWYYNMDTTDGHLLGNFPVR